MKFEATPSRRLIFDVTALRVSNGELDRVRPELETLAWVMRTFALAQGVSLDTGAAAIHALVLRTPAHITSIWFEVVEVDGATTPRIGWGEKVADDPLAHHGRVMN